MRFALDETTYVVEGTGLATIWAGDGPKRTFEFGKHSMFIVPRGYQYQLANSSGAVPVRLLQLQLPSDLHGHRPGPEVLL